MLAAVLDNTNCPTFPEQYNWSTGAVGLVSLQQQTVTMLASQPGVGAVD